MISPFQIQSDEEFESLALKTFQFQYLNNDVYREYVELSGLSSNPTSIREIPFLPIEFFKSKKVVSTNHKPKQIFTSSSTTGQGVSKHHINDLSIYETSIRLAFERAYGPISELKFLFLLPSYLERKGSSLVYMANDFIQASKYSESGFFLDNAEELVSELRKSEDDQIPTFLIGVTFALLDLAEQFPMPLKHTVVMETGGMKGRKKEMTRQTVHSILKDAFKLNEIHSEYGMTELLSQAYSESNGIYRSPAWMKVLTRDTGDPFRILESDQTGGINIIDLANQESCAFIATQDLGKVYSDQSFEILGRFDNSDIRGCSLMAV